MGKLSRDTNTKMDRNTVRHEWLIKDMDDYCLQDQVIYSNTFGNKGDSFQLKLFTQGDNKSQRSGVKSLSLHLTQIEWRQKETVEKEHVVLKMCKSCYVNRTMSISSKRRSTLRAVDMLPGRFI